MDPLSQFLTEPRARDAFTLRVVMAPPFGIQVQDEAALTLIVPVEGTAWLMTEHEPAQLLCPGLVATVRGPAPYSVADSVNTAPTIVIGPDQTCRTPEGDHLELAMRQGVRTWGNNPDGKTTLLIGTYASDAAVGRLVISALPPVVVLRDHEVDAHLTALLERELATSSLGQAGALDRLLDLMLMHAVRAVAARAESPLASWAAGPADPLVASALTLLHDEPAAPWTVAELAHRLHVSRATLAARFRSTVRQPPMSYLTTWRLALAADRLVDDDATTATIATEVGYSSAFTFSTAFTRAYGLSPTAYRRLRRQRVSPG